MLRPFLAAALILAGLGSAHATAIAWGACTPEFLADFPALAPRIDCARTAVPLDHHAATSATSATLMLDLVRVRAGIPAHRQGNLFVNPGGPGVPSLQFTVSLVADWEGDRAPNAAKRRIAERYDVVGIQPRGLQGPQRLRCQSAQLLVPYASISEDRSAANLDAADLHAATVAAGCQTQSLARYINTEQIARDMELVRQRTGDEPLNYWGVSWGTELGAWYGALFPGHAGRMILDSNVDWSRDLYHSWLAQGPARQAVFDHLVVERVIGRPLVYGLGSRPDEVRQHFLALGGVARAMVRSSVADPDVMVAAVFLDTVVAADPEITLQALHAAVQKHTFSPDPEVHAAARQWAALFAAQFFAAPELPAPLDLDAGTSVFHAVSCQSSQSMPAPAWWRAQGDLAMLGWPVGGAHNSHEPCAFWNGPVLERPDMKALESIPELLMLQAEHDWRTPLHGALQAHAVVSNVSLVVARGVEGHGLVYNGASSCVDDAAGRFLADGLKPPRMLDCVDAPGPRSVPTHLQRMNPRKRQDAP